MTASGLAHAGGQSGSLGVGAEFQLRGVGGASLNYDAGDFHVGGFLGFGDNLPMAADTLEVGGRFYYHLHSTAMSDFGVGGSLGVASVDNPPMNNRDSYIFLEPGAQIRLFLAANVALSFTTGVSIGVNDADGVLITGQGTGLNFGGGIHYYFF